MLSKYTHVQCIVFLQLLQRLNNELRNYESLYRAEDSSCEPSESQSQGDGTISTYTVTLINALHRMMGYFHQV